MTYFFHKLITWVPVCLLLLPVHSNSNYLLPPIPSSTVMSKYYKSFLAALKKQPHMFNGISSFLLFAGSDVVAQIIEKRSQASMITSSSSTSTSTSTIGGASNSSNKQQIQRQLQKHNEELNLDYHRLISAGGIGILCGCGVYPAAYSQLEKMFPGKKFTTVLKKSIMEICTVGIFVNSLSMFLRGFSLGKDVNDVVKHVYDEIPVVTITDAKVWLPYNILAFSMIPQHVRPTTTALMESGWQTYISYVANGYSDPNGSNNKNEQISSSIKSSSICMNTTS